MLILLSTTKVVVSTDSLKMGFEDLQMRPSVPPLGPLCSWVLLSSDYWIAVGIRNFWYIAVPYKEGAQAFQDTLKEKASSSLDS